jgi:hypothetical protein
MGGKGLQVAYRQAAALLVTGGQSVVQWPDQVPGECMGGWVGGTGFAPSALCGSSQPHCRKFWLEVLFTGMLDAMLAVEACRRPHSRPHSRHSPHRA